eukprot:1143757-Rhodomonas_salina.1
MSGTNIGYPTRSLCDVRYAMSGTEMRYAATSLVLQGMTREYAHTTMQVRSLRRFASFCTDVRVWYHRPTRMAGRCLVTDMGAPYIECRTGIAYCPILIAVLSWGIVTRSAPPQRKRAVLSDGVAVPERGTVLSWGVFCTSKKRAVPYRKECSTELGCVLYQPEGAQS